MDPRTIAETIVRNYSGSSISCITIISSVLSRRPSKIRHFLVTSFLSAHYALSARITSSMRSQTRASSSAKFYFFFSIIVSFSNAQKRFSSSVSLVRIFSRTYLIVANNVSTFSGMRSCTAISSRSTSSWRDSPVDILVSNIGIRVFKSFCRASC